MEENILECTLITPMFTYGAYRNEDPEIRATGIKGMMRYVYRMTCPIDFRELAKIEAELFGGAAGNWGASAGHASPVRLMVYDEETHTTKRPLLLHDKQRCNPPMKYFYKGSFKLKIWLKPVMNATRMKNIPEVDLNWYTELIKLTFMLCGIGKRNRKGRGSVAVGGTNGLYGSVGDALSWICTTLNKVNEVTAKPHEPAMAIYTCNEGGIVSSWFDKDRDSSKDKVINRPLIQKILVGSKLCQNQIEQYLRVVDQTCHRIKNDSSKTMEQKNATGSRAIGLASPIIISLIQTKEGIYPLYIFVKAVYDENKKKGVPKYVEIDSNYNDREEYVEYIEEGMEEVKK